MGCHAFNLCCLNAVSIQGEVHWLAREYWKGERGKLFECDAEMRSINS